MTMPFHCAGHIAKASAVVEEADLVLGHCLAPGQGEEVPIVGADEVACRLKNRAEGAGSALIPLAGRERLAKSQQPDCGPGVVAERVLHEGPGHRPESLEPFLARPRPS